MRVLASALLLAQVATVFGDSSSSSSSSSSDSKSLDLDTSMPTSFWPTTVLPTTIMPTSVVPTTILPTSENPTSEFPTTVYPTSAFPYTACMDSTRPFMYKEDDTRDCHWVARENTAERCELGNGSVKTNCPATCGYCDPCVDSKKPFMTLEKGMRTCDWVTARGNERYIPSRCKDIGDSSTCRKSCRQCPTEPIVKCQDSSARFYVNGIPRACGWVAGAPETKCARGFVASHCPLTCGMCDQPVKNSGATFEVKGLTEKGDPNNFRTCKWVSEKSINWRCAMIGDDCGVSTCPLFCKGCVE